MTSVPKELVLMIYQITVMLRISKKFCFSSANMLCGGQELRYIIIWQSALSTGGVVFPIFLYCGLFSWFLERVAGSIVFPCTQILGFLGASDLLCLSRIAMYVQKLGHEEEWRAAKLWNGGWLGTCCLSCWHSQVNFLLSYLCEWMVGKLYCPPGLCEAPGL